MRPANPRAKAGSSPEKSEVNAASPGSDGLLLVARGNPIGWPNAPIRRRRGSPIETPVSHEMHERPLRIVRMVCRHAQFPPGLQDPGNLVKRSRLDETSLVVAEFGPGIRKQHKHDGKTGIRQTLKDVTRIVWVNPDVRQSMRTDLCEQLGNAILEWLASDKPRLRVRNGLRSKMFAPAETYL